MKGNWFNDFMSICRPNYSLGVNSIKCLAVMDTVLDVFKGIDRPVFVLFSSFVKKNSNEIDLKCRFYKMKSHSASQTYRSIHVTLYPHARTESWTLEPSLKRRWRNRLVFLITLIIDQQMRWTHCAQISLCIHFMCIRDTVF